MKVLLFVASISLLSGLATAQDSLYIYKGGSVVSKRATAQIDSIVFYNKTITTPPLSTITYGNMTDCENNSYKTVLIGNQTWMAENLKSNKYNDCSAIPNVIEASAWATLTTGAVCTYNNTTNSDTINTYGRLYNWYAVNTGKLCPTGWHVPSDSEWTTLQNYLIANGYNYDGSTKGNFIAKSMSSTTGWSSSTITGAIGNMPSTNNKSGFIALPGGSRDDVSGKFGTMYGTIGSFGYWWSSTDYWSSFAGVRGLYYGGSYIDCNGGGIKVSGFSVRCLKN